MTVWSFLSFTMEGHFHFETSISMGNVRRKSFATLKMEEKFASLSLGQNQDTNGDTEWMVKTEPK